MRRSGSDTRQPVYCKSRAAAVKFSVSVGASFVSEASKLAWTGSTTAAPSPSLPRLLLHHPIVLHPLCLESACAARPIVGRQHSCEFAGGSPRHSNRVHREPCTRRRRRWEPDLPANTTPLRSSPRLRLHQTPPQTHLSIASLARVAPAASATPPLQTLFAANRHLHHSSILPTPPRPTTIQHRSHASPQTTPTTLASIASKTSSSEPDTKRPASSLPTATRSQACWPTSSPRLRANPGWSTTSPPTRPHSPPPNSVEPSIDPLRPQARACPRAGTNSPQIHLRHHRCLQRTLLLPAAGFPASGSLAGRAPSSVTLHPMLRRNHRQPLCPSRKPRITLPSARALQPIAYNPHQQQHHRPALRHPQPRKRPHRTTPSGPPVSPTAAPDRTRHPCARAPPPPASPAPSSLTTPPRSESGRRFKMEALTQPSRGGLVSSMPLPVPPRSHPPATRPSRRAAPASSANGDKSAQHGENRSATCRP